MRIYVIKYFFNKMLYIKFSGETGLGKSTLMDSLFNTSFESTPSPHNLPTVKLKAHTYELQESNVRLKVMDGWISNRIGERQEYLRFCI
jgi:septin family protein